MEQHRFTSTTLFISSSLLIWMADFLFVYVFAALACARRFASSDLFGISIVPLVTTASTLLAVLATAAVIWMAASRLRRKSTVDVHARFIHRVAIGAGVLTLIALAWLALPPLIAVARC